MVRTSTVLACMITALLLAVGGVALASPSNVPDAGTVQTDGQVSAIAVAGNTIYLGGYFTHVDGVQRNRLAAIDATTGQLTSWNPNANDNVRSLAVSADGSRIYAGGAFSSVGGVNRTRLAAIDAATGAVDPLWRPQANSSVRSIAVSAKGIYLGGSFASINKQSRSRLALVDATTGALDPNWVPSADNLVRTVAVASDGSRIYAGGDFSTINGTSRPYLTALEPSTGALDSAWVTPTKPNGKVYEVQESGGRVYAGEGGLGGAVSAYNTATGVINWRTKGDGDVQTLAVLGSKVYLGGHFETFSGQNRHFFAAVDAVTGALDPNWAPPATGNCGAWIPSTCNGFVWALTADPSAGRLYAGGNFRKVSGIDHAGFARFSDNGQKDPETRMMTASADAMIAEGAPIANYDGATSLNVDGDTGSGRDEAALLKWDFSDIAPGTNVSSASVTLTVSNTSPQTYEAYALRRGWKEAEVTWNSYAAGLPWEVAGAKGSLDRAIQAAGTITPSATGEQTFLLSPGLVQSWVDNPASNQGIIIADADNTNGMSFYSRESDTGGQQPRLTVALESTSP